MSTTPTRIGDHAPGTDTATGRPALTIATIVVVATLIGGGLWFVAARGGGPESFPVLEQDVVAEANELVGLIEAYEATWDTGDLQAFTDLLAEDDFNFTEPGTHITTRDGFVAYMEPYFVDPETLGSIDRRYFVGDGEVVESYQTWGWSGIPETDPVVEVERFTIEDDEISSIHSMYEPDWLSSAADPIPVFARYAAAWSSGDPDEFQALYAPDARRSEGLYRIELEGTDEITRHAAAFLDRHPDARWTVVEPYVFTSGLLSGTVFTLSEADGCPIGLSVLVELDDTGLILREWVYHDVATIEACSWQR